MTSLLCHQWRVWIDYVNDKITLLMYSRLQQHCCLLPKTSERRKSASPSAIQVKNPRKMIRIEDKLDVINLLEKDERPVDIWFNVSFAHSGIRKILDNVARITSIINQQMHYI